MVTGWNTSLRTPSGACRARTRIDAVAEIEAQADKVKALVRFVDITRRRDEVVECVSRDEVDAALAIVVQDATHPSDRRVEGEVIGQREEHRDVVQAESAC